MTPLAIREELKELDEEIKKHQHHHSPLQLRAFRRRKAKLKKWLNGYQKMMKFSRPKEQLALSL
jgi:hypothetical protein